MNLVRIRIPDTNTNHLMTTPREVSAFEVCKRKGCASP